MGRIMSANESGAGRKGQPRGASVLLTREVWIDGSCQQVRLEPSYWDALEEICRREDVTVDDLCADLQRRLVDQARRMRERDAERASLANAIRVFTVGYFRQAATETGHDRAGHGRGDPFSRHPAVVEGSPVRH